MSTIARPNNQDQQRSQATPVEDVVTDSGTVEKGALTIGFFNNHASADATVNGETLAAGVSKTYPFVGKQYTAITYDASSSSLEIVAIF